MTAIMTARSLQDEFDAHVRDMKSYVLALRLKSERQKCALWIRKLCDVQQGLAARRVRNSYSKALLFMLKKGTLDLPFRTTPSSGPLAPLPAHLIHYIDSCTTSDVPNWVADLSQDSRLAVALDSVKTYDTDADDRGEDHDVDALDVPQYGAASPVRAAPRSPPKSPKQPLSPAKGANVRSPDRLPPQRRLSGGGGRRSPYDRSSCSEELDRNSTDAGALSAVARQPSPSFSPSKQRPQAPRRDVYRSLDVLSGHNGEDGERESSSDGGCTADRLRPPSPRRAVSGFCADDDSDRRREDDFSELRRSSPSPLGKGYRSYSFGPSLRSPPPQPAQELDVKLRAFEARLRDETVQLHKKQDSALQKVLQKRSGELEEMKQRFQAKVREQEETIARLEKKVQTIVKDSALVRESKDQQIAELRKLADDSTENRQNEFERRLHDLVAEHERDQFELQKQHTRVIQELTEEVTSRIAKMESDHKRQLSSADDVACQLDARIQHMSGELDQLTKSKGALEQQKAELEAKLDEALKASHELKSQAEALGAEIERQAEDHQRAMEQTRQKFDAQNNAMRREQSMAASRASEVTAELEHRVASLQHALTEAAAQAERRLADQDHSFKMELAAAERRHEQKVRNLNIASEQSALEHQVTIQSFEGRLREKDAAMQQQSEQLKLQFAQSESTIAEIRAQAEKRVEQAQATCRQKLVQAEESAESLKALHEQQTRAQQEELVQLRRDRDKELFALRAQHEREKEQLIDRERQQREAVATAHAQELERLTINANADKARLGEILRATQQEYNGHAAELSDEISALREEIATNEQLRRQQLSELRLLHDEERQRLAREHDREASRQRADAERSRHELQRAHASEVECLLQNHDSKVKQMEADYTARLAKAAETAQELRALLEQTKAERHELLERMEAQLAEHAAAFEDEKRTVRQQMSAAVLALQADMETQRDALRHAERRLREAEADHEEKLLRATLDYESKMKGLMPAAARQQLEDTIASLRSQVATLKQRVGLLQGEQLDAQRLQLVGRKAHDESGDGRSASGAENAESCRRARTGSSEGGCDSSLNGSLTGSSSTPPISI